MLPLYCPVCKQPVEPGDRFCKGCGASQNAPAPPGLPRLPRRFLLRPSRHWLRFAVPLVGTAAFRR